MPMQASNLIGESRCRIMTEFGLAFTHGYKPVCIFALPQVNLVSYICNITADNIILLVHE